MNPLDGTLNLNKVSVLLNQARVQNIGEITTRSDGLSLRTLRDGNYFFNVRDIVLDVQPGMFEETVPILQNPETGLFTSVSYSRFEPLSGLLAVAADYAWAANHSPNTESAMEDLTNLAMNGSYAIFNYMGHLPMLQAIGDVSQLWGKEYETFDDRVQRAKQLLTEQVTTYGLSVGQQAVTFGIFPETLVANYERAISPGASNVMPSTTDGDFMLLGWSSALNRWKSRNPLFNDEVLPLLNFWG